MSREAFGKRGFGMHISTLEEYGVRCALQLAKSYSQGPVAASCMAASEGLSVEYTSKIMHLFRKGGLVQSERGNQGGFFLAKNPAEVSLWAIFESLRSDKHGERHEFCQTFRGLETECVHYADCSLRPVWEMIEFYFQEVLRSLSLEDLLVKEKQSRQRVSVLASEKAQKVFQVFNSHKQNKSCQCVGVSQEQFEDDGKANERKTSF